MVTDLRNKNCKLCPLHLGAINVCVFGEGSASLPVLILGEAPGREEDTMNRPFVGASGKLLRSELLKTGLPLKKCYITNAVKCYPHGTPDQKEISKCTSTYLQKEIRTLNPDYILTVGRIALGAVLPGYPLAEVRGQVCESWASDSFVFPVWHPAYILRNKSKLGEWRKDLENFYALLKVDGIL